MLLPFSKLKDCRLICRDGIDAEARDFRFNEGGRTIRYLVAHVGSWFRPRSVAVSVYFLGEADLAEKAISIALTKREVRRSPPPNPKQRSIPGASGSSAPLRSCTELLSDYTLRTRSGQIGFVEDFLIDTEAWRLRYVVIRTGLLFSGKMLLLPLRFVQEITVFPRRQIIAALPRATIEAAPEFQPGALHEADYEDRVREHFDRACNLRA